MEMDTSLCSAKKKENNLNQCAMQILNRITLADPGGPFGPAPLPPRFYVPGVYKKSCSFQAILSKNPPILSKFWAQGPPGVKTLLVPPDQNPG